jgi:hypothetical protein
LKTHRLLHAVNLMMLIAASCRIVWIASSSSSGIFLLPDGDLLRIRQFNWRSHPFTTLDRIDHQTHRRVLGNQIASRLSINNRLQANGELMCTLTLDYRSFLIGLEPSDF